MGTNCAPLLAELFLYSYEADFTQGLHKKNEKKITRSFNVTFRYIDDEPFNSLKLRVRNNCVESREVKWFNAIAGGEGSSSYVL
jgi:uncharacterized protein YaeQ